MDHEPDWSGMLLTLGGIDKAGHMWGGLNDVPPYADRRPAAATWPAMAKVADEQVGRVIDKLKTDGVLDETLVVLTTDHAQNTAENYYGSTARTAATSTGTTARTPTRTTPSRSRRSRS